MPRFFDTLNDRYLVCVEEIFDYPNQQQQLMPKSATIISIKFKFYPRFLLHSRSLFTSETIQIPIDNPESAKQLQLQTMAALGFPESVHEKILNKIDSQIISGTSGSEVPRVIKIFLSEMNESQLMRPINWTRESHLMRATNRSLEGQSWRVIPAEKSAIGQLQRVATNDDGDCAVCLEEMKGGDGADEIIRMPCAHSYHGDCIVKWLNVSHHCPLCRYQMPHQQS